MTREEAIQHGREQLEIFGGEHKEFIAMAIRSFEAWDKVINAIDRNQFTLINSEKNYIKWLIDKHMKEVEDEKEID